MAVDLIYLDYNATTPIAPSVLDAMEPFLSRQYGNPSSDHVLGRACMHAVEDAREKIAELVSADPEEIVFTSSGSESNNLAIKGIAAACAVGTRHLITTAIEHPAVTQPIEFLRRQGYDVTTVSCDAHGVVAAADVEQAIRDETALVSVMHANNETGAIQPIEEIAAICRARNVPLHTDAAQSVGKIPTNVTKLGVDLLTIVGHKIYAPKGIGALFVRHGTNLESLIHGADHEFGLRAGTENVPYIVALGKAASLASRGHKESNERLRSLRDTLEQRLLAAIGDQLQINAAGADRLPNTLSVNFPGVSSRKLLARVPEVCASTGAACHSDQDQVSGTLAAMGVTAHQARGTVRFSVGWPTSLDEVERAGRLVVGAWESLTQA